MCASVAGAFINIISYRYAVPVVLVVVEEDEMVRI